MKEHIGLGVFGTFGQPYGYQQIFFFDTYFYTSLDLNTNVLELSQNAELYAVKKELIDGVFSVCFCIYSFAKELTSTRGGTFIGTCVVLNECYADARDIYILLKELHDDTVKNPKNVLNNKIQVQIADELEIRKPLKFDEVKSRVTSINETAFRSDFIDPEKTFLVKGKPSVANKEKNITLFFEYAFENFSDFETLYFTFDKSVISHIENKGILNVIEWSDFVESEKMTIQRKNELKDEISQASGEGENGQFLINNEKAGYDAHLLREKNDDNEQLLNENENPDYTGNFDLSLNKPFYPWNFNNEKLTSPEIREKANEYNRLLNYCIELQENLSNLNKIIVTSRDVPLKKKIDLDKQRREKLWLVDILIILVSFGIVLTVFFLQLSKPQREGLSFKMGKIFTDTLHHNSSARKAKDSIFKELLKP